MSDDRPIAPSPLRVQRAWEAGMRPRARWLGIGALALAASAAVSATTASGLADAIGLLDLEGDLAAAGRRLAFGATAIAGGVVAVVVVLTLATGGLGAISARARDALRPAAVREPVVALAILGLVLAIAGGLAMRGAIAGSARAVAASPESLAALWHAWLVRGLAIMGALAVAVGMAELVLARRAQRLALFQSEADARMDRRAAGARGR